VLVRWWARLVPGVAAGLTHGLIRTTHIVRSIARHPQAPTDLQLRELATALSYWAARYVEQPGEPVLVGGDRLPGILSSIPRLDPQVKLGLHEKGLFLHMPGVTGWGDAVARLDAPADTDRALSDLTTAFVQVNLAHPDQFPIPLVHTVTAPAALRLMLPHLPPELHLPSLVAVWRAGAALLTTFAGPRPAEVQTTLPDGVTPSFSPTELAERAVEHGDEHAMKFTEACLREYAIRPDPRFLVAAEQMQGKLPRYYRGTRTST
jgi:hypothetical protein